jgi:hypothetical protein
MVGSVVGLVAAQLLLLLLLPLLLLMELGRP